MSAAAPSFAQGPAAEARPSRIVMLDAVALGDAIRSRQVSCVEVMGGLSGSHRENQSAGQRHRCPSGASADLLAQARERDAPACTWRIHGAAAWFSARGEGSAGGQRDSHDPGISHFEEFRAGCRRIMVERLRSAGVIFIGKTNTPEFGWARIPTNRLWRDPQCVRSDSLGRGQQRRRRGLSGTAHAAGRGRHPTIGGSLRNPAGWNNVFGFRTSIGRVPTSEHDDGCPP